jgi:hypothetical protein
MTPYNNNPVHLRMNMPSTDDADVVLRQFFQAALPQTWPPSPAPLDDQMAPPSDHQFAKKRWLRLPGRLAIAASVAGLVVGFGAVQTWFPEPQPGIRSQIDESRPMGFKSQPGKVVDPKDRDRPPDENHRLDVP